MIRLDNNVILEKKNGNNNNNYEPRHFKNMGSFIVC